MPTLPTSMHDPAAPPHVRIFWPRSSWRLLRISTLNERSYRTRIILAPLTLAVQLYLYSALWSAVFANTSSAAGMNERQTVTYALMALLVARIRWNAKTVGIRDSVSVSIREGTIAYWFMRPISPGQYYMWRQASDMAYGAVWVIIGYVILLATETILKPSGLAAGLVFLVSAILGQIIFYYLGQIVDVSMFWLLSNYTVVRIYHFFQDILSGVFVPLPFLPVFLSSAIVWLPFRFALDIPLSFYIERIPLSKAPGMLLTPVSGSSKWVPAMCVSLR